MRHSPRLALLTLVLVGCGSAAPTGTPSTAPSASPTVSTMSTTPTDRPSGIASPTRSASATTPAIIVTPPAARPPTTPTRPGTYTYLQEGTQSLGSLTFAIDPDGTFEVFPAKGTTQRTVRNYSSSRSRDATVRFQRDGIALLEATERVRFGAEERAERCATPEPIILLPIPWTIGGSWSGGGRCEDHTIAFDATLTKRASIVIEGTAVEALVIDATIRLREGGLTQDSTVRMWMSPEHRIILKQTESTTGTIDGTPYARELTETLRSLRPA